MMRAGLKYSFFIFIFLCHCFSLMGCTVKAVGDPNRPSTIKHHITINIRGLKDTATDIEDFVSGDIKKEEISD